MYKKYFSKFLKANEGTLHFACHSHHYWPDCTRDAQIEYWDDSARMVDHKWNYVFGTKLKNVQKHLAKILNFRNHDQITFAPNTHELVYRVLSSFFSLNKKMTILTTDSEFYSFNRQLNRLVEAGFAEAKKVSLHPFGTFVERFQKESKNKNYDVTFSSQVFFNSGFAIQDLGSFVDGLNNDSTIIIDGYHAFMAIPIDLSKLEGKIFFTAGGYKYAGSGEGCCFLISPKDTKLEPVNTGWFAEMGNLSNANTETTLFPSDGFRFAGSTLDLTSLYRMDATFKLYQDEKINVQLIHDHVRKNQKQFLNEIKNSHLQQFLITPIETENFGHFIAFDFKDNKLCSDVYEQLKRKNIETDFRKTVLRFGFCIYQNTEDINELTQIINTLNPKS